MEVTKLLNYRSYIYAHLFRFFFRSSFKAFGRNSSIISPLKIDGARYIEIGDKVYIAYKAWLAAMPLTNCKEPKLVIGDGTQIGNFNHIYCTKSINIGKNVLTADKVYITDNLHSYENVLIPIQSQPIKQISIVKIGDGAWIGENVCIIGANVGINSIIGANSVVTKDVPDYAVAVGNPARVIKRFCHESSEWLKTDNNGNFI